MTVVFIKPQLRVCAGRAEVTGVILPFMVTPTTDAWQMPVTVADELVKGLLGLLNEVAEWFHCLTTLSQTLTFGLLPLKSALFIFPLLLGFGCVIHSFSMYTGTFI